MKYIAIILFLYFFSKFFLFINEFIVYIYHLSNVSSFMSLPFVVSAIWFVLLVGGFGFLVALRNVRTAVEGIIILCPMSALPFIVLGIPLGALNSLFICRSAVNLFVYALYFKWFFGHVLSGRHVLKFPKLLVIVPLMTVYLLSAIFAEAEIRTGVILSCVILVSCVLFFYMIINIVTDKKSLVRLLEIMVVACIIQVMMSSLSFFYYLVIKGERVLRVEGMLRDFELFAEYMALHIPLFIYFLRNPGEFLKKGILKLFLLVTLFVLFATATRGAILSLGFALIYYIWNMKSRVALSKIITQIVIWGVTAAAVLGVLYVTLPSAANIIERFAETRVGTLDTRQYVWLKFWEYFWDKPVFGYGMVYSLGTYLFFPHSTYLFYMLTLGIPGLLAYLLLIVTILLTGLGNVRRSRSDGRLFEIAVTVNTMFVIFFIDSIKIEYLRYPNYQLFIWLLFSLIVVVNGLVKGKVKAI